MNHAIRVSSLQTMHTRDRQNERMQQVQAG
jgi:hypothetical protein